MCALAGFMHLQKWLSSRLTFWTMGDPAAWSPAHIIYTSKRKQVDYMTSEILFLNELSMMIGLVFQVKTKSFWTLWTGVPMKWLVIGLPHCPSVNPNLRCLATSLKLWTEPTTLAKVWRKMLPKEKSLSLLWKSASMKDMLRRLLHWMGMGLGTFHYSVSFIQGRKSCVLCLIRQHNIKEFPATTFLLNGPNLTNSLVGVLMHFRMESVAIAANVEQMFHSFFVAEKDRDYLRFLWHDDNDLDLPLTDYRMCVHVFGNNSSPAIATYGMRKCIESGDYSDHLREYVFTTRASYDYTRLPQIAKTCWLPLCQMIWAKI